MQTGGLEGDWIGLLYCKNLAYKHFAQHCAFPDFPESENHSSHR